MEGNLKSNRRKFTNGYAILVDDIIKHIGSKWV